MTPLVSILIPSWKRTALLERCVKSWKSLAADPQAVEIVVRLHLDDAESMKWAESRPYGIHLIAGEHYQRHASMGIFINCLAACSSGDWLMPASDDFECLTQDWENTLRTVTDDPRHKLYMRHFEMVDKPRERPPIITRGFYHAIGCFGHTDFADVYVDTLGWRLGINKLEALPVKFRNNIGPFHDTTKNWEAGEQRYKDPYIQWLLENDYRKAKLIIDKA